MNESVSENGAQQSAKPLTLADRVRSLRLPESSRQPRSQIAWLPWILCIILGLSTGFFALRAYDQPAEQPPPAITIGQQPTNGAPAPRPTGYEEVALKSKGYILPVQQIQVSPKVGGMVLKLNFKEGTRVKKDDILAELETTDYQADFDRAKKNWEAAGHRWQELTKYRKDEIHQVQAELEDHKVQRVQLDKDYKRALALRSSNAGSQQDLEQAQTLLKSMERRVERLDLALKLMKEGPRDEKIAAAKAEMEMAQAELDKAVWRLSNTRVKAPISGIILTKRTEEGSIVNPSAFSNGLAASLCDLADLTNMEVDLAIAERDIGKVHEGQKCKINAEAFPDRFYDGYVSRLMPTADRSKGAVPVRVKIEIPREEEGVYLRPEMGAIVVFLNKK